jgi:S-adenosylmethionine hydrolase
MKRKRKIGNTRASKRSVIALLTDFGDLDHYVGTMKGVILSINPTARIVDISHNVAPQNTTEAGYLLWASYRYFPAHTIFVCVVDPGVGTDRKIVCVETPLYQFVAPDNGLLDFIVRSERVVASYEITHPPRLGLNPVSATFHGRDIFAPVGAHLSLGEPARKFGKRYVLSEPHPVFYDPEKGVVNGCVLHIDRFGNLVTNIPGSLIEGLVLRVGGFVVGRHIRNFSEGPESEPCLIAGSSSLVEIVLKDGSAAKKLNANSGMRIHVSPEGKRPG